MKNIINFKIAKENKEEEKDFGIYNVVYQVILDKIIIVSYIDNTYFFIKHNIFGNNFVDVKDQDVFISYVKNEENGFILVDVINNVHSMLIQEND